MRELFSFTMNPLELVARGTMMYLGLVLVLRFVLRRDVGSMSMADVLFIVLIADASQNAMARRIQIRGGRSGAHRHAGGGGTWRWTG